ncbi:alpha/beta fold hydrolase [Kitasatospora sp. NPDC058063]|uniref:alpha/beta fold hydrolase n=1 Tax=unclassified Kitasatospora TaxID=2633591 RepID=UPI0036DACF31
MPTDGNAPVVVRKLAGSGRRTLLVHGLGANASVWDTCAGPLAAGHELWTAQLPWRGEGVDDWARGPELGHWLAEALRLVPGGAEVVVAHSMSANVLLDLLDRESRRGTDPFTRFGIRALVLVSPFYRGSAEDFDWPTISYYLNDFHLILEEGLRAHSGGRLGADIQRAMAHRVRDRIGPYGWLRFFDLYLGTPGLQTGRIAVPCLVFGGGRDFAAPPGEARALAAALPDARLRVLPTGHFPMIERPEEFAAEIREFLNSIPAGDPQHGPGPRTVLEHH